MIRHAAIILLAAAALALAGCAETEFIANTAKTVQGPSEPAPVGRYKVGNAYQISGQWYYPAENAEYVETGIASWYGPGFHAKQTANGEQFDENAMTAAHRTLPLPSAVRVTNLENGRAVVLRINDRGPFARGRIIDVSRRGAQLLGFINQGTAKVRVEILPAESQKLKMAALNLPMSEEQPMQISAAPREAVMARELPSPTGGASAATPEVQVVSAPVVRAAPAQPPALSQAVEVLPVSPTGIYVQAGAFGDLQNALRLRDRLYPLGNTQISRFPVGDSEVYRVRIGPLASVELADDTLNQVLGAGISEARLVVD
jgi:rare lipoprotein A